MRTFLINSTTKKNIELLETPAVDMESILAIPLWGEKEFVVEKVVHHIHTVGDEKNGYKADLVLSIYVKKSE